MIHVIGFGNPLRGDDGVGWTVAEGLEICQAVEVTRTQMLVPELAERIAAATAVIFVDAGIGWDAGAVHCHAIHSRAPRHSLGHVADPEGLLCLAETLFGRRPRAYVVSVTGADFDFRHALSAPVIRAVPEAIRTIRDLIESLTMMETEEMSDATRIQHLAATVPA